MAPNPFTYSMARRSSRASWTPWPSSVKSRTLALHMAISPMAARCLPSRPWVSAPAGITWVSPRKLPVAATFSATAALSQTGSVLGMAQMAVYPPSTAAAEPEAMVSSSSRPGSRMCTWVSTKPGATMAPSTSMTSARPGSSPVPTASMRPAAISTSQTASASPAGSTRRPPRSRMSANGDLLHRPVGGTEHEVQQGHPHGDPVGDLVDDDRALQVRHVGGDLDAPVHRAGMHDDRLGFHELHPAAVEPPEGGVLPQRRHELLVLALLLHPQQVDDIELRQHPFQVVAHLGSPALDGGRDERRRGDQGHLRPHLGQCRHAGAGNPGGEDVADHAHPQSVDTREVLPDRVQVEQGLGRVLVGSVAGIDDAGLHPPGEAVRR